MRPPPIRYPLPTLAALLALAALARAGGGWIYQKMERLAPTVVLGDTVYPSSTKPRVFFGPVPQRVLLLGRSIPVTATPDGPALDPIRHSMFVNVFDSWPRKGISTHLRVGNKKAIGWVEATRILGWNSRLVLRAEGSLEIPAGVYPVLSWRDGRVDIATWKSGREWSEIDQYRSIEIETLPPAAWQIWCSYEELQTALGETVSPQRGRKPGSIRGSALFGTLGASEEWDTKDLELASNDLPPAVAAIPLPILAVSAQRLAEINQKWTADARWSGVEYRAVPVSDFP